MPRLITFIIVLTCFSKLFSQDIDHWESVVLNTTTLKYTIPETELSASWTAAAFDDSGWNNGTGGVGYGDGDDNTIVPAGTMSVYMRIKFTIDDLSPIAAAVLTMDFDDGFAAFLNGVEIARSVLGDSGSAIVYNQPADYASEAKLYAGLLPPSFTIDTSLLLPGENVLAITVHNTDIYSSDLSSNAFLSVGITNPSTYFFDTPAWFVPPFVSSTLPLVFINTLGQTIQDEPRITCNMGIINNGPGTTNYLTDPFNNYNGNVSIEIRGSSSQSFPKKCYSFELQNASALDTNVSLLNLPADDDWILYGPYTDKSFLRDVLTFYLAGKQGWYAPQFAWCEVFLNGEYQGVYILLEKIKIQKNRVNLLQMDSTIFAGDNITGGYIIKVDRPDYYSAEQDYFLSDYYGDGWPYDVTYVYVDPPIENINDAQKIYIENYIDNFENVMFSDNYSDVYEGYNKYIDVPSFVDYMIMNEMSRNVDAYRLSTYFYKNNDAYGGKLYAGPLWDFSLAWGNADYCSAWTSSGFFTDCGTGPTWWDTLFQDTNFKNLFTCRWKELRQGYFSDDSINNWINQQVDILGPAVARNYATWPILGNYIWPNYFVGDNFGQEINYLKTWIQLRSQWIDNNLPGDTAACSAALVSPVVISEIDYHTDSTWASRNWVELYNNSANPVDISSWTLKDETPFNSFTIPAGTTINANSYLVICQYIDTFLMVYPGVTNSIGSFIWGMDNTSGSIRLLDQFNNLVQQIDYIDSLPWPNAAGGFGPTLERKDILAEENNPSNWFAGCIGGSPGGPYVPCNYDLVVDEINYNSSPSFNMGDWMELWNRSGAAINIGNWEFRDNKGSHIFHIPSGTILDPDERLVVSDSLSAMNTLFPSLTNITGDFTFGLSANGDAIRLYDNTPKLRYSIRYDDTLPWPSDADGNGFTLELVTPEGNPNDATAWIAGCLYGSPGYAFTLPCPDVPVIDISENYTVNVQPNPFTDNIIFDFTSIPAGIIQNCSIKNLLGDDVFRFNYKNQLLINWNGTDNNGNKIANGIYFLNVQITSGKNIIVKIIKS